jgi:hypothetical protein
MFETLNITTPVVPEKEEKNLARKRMEISFMKSTRMACSHPLSITHSNQAFWTED